MGAGASKKPGSHPDSSTREDGPLLSGSPEWVLMYSKEYSLSIPEVEIMFLRFSRLRPDRKGLVQVESLLGDDASPFRENLVEMMPQEKGKMNFDEFLKVMKWWKVSDIGKKANRVFDMLDVDGDGQLSIDDLRPTIEECVPDFDAEVAARSIVLLIAKDVGSSRTNAIDRSSFLDYIMKFPNSELATLMGFRIIDKDLSFLIQDKTSTTFKPSTGTRAKIRIPSAYNPPVSRQPTQD